MVEKEEESKKRWLDVIENDMIAAGACAEDAKDRVGTQGRPTPDNWRGGEG